MADQDTYRVKLEIFEGPLDLLLYLIRKNEVDIYDIPVALIVEQYMAYVDILRTLNLEVAGDFLVMAATLSHIKSMMLLPPDPSEAGEEEGQDPRAELVKKLLEYQRFKEAADELYSRQLLGRDVFVREPAREAIQEAAQASGIPEVTFAEVGIFALLEAFKGVMERANITNWHEVTVERVTIVDRINHILSLLKEVPTLAFEQLFTEITDRITVITTFLALLELVRLKVLRIQQDKQFEPIHLVRAVDVDDQWLLENIPDLDREN